MEKFLQQLHEWEDEHEESYISKKTPGYDWIGTGISAQLDLMSPTAAYDFAMNPNTFNAMKMGYNPAIAFAGYSWVQAVTGMQIGFANRMVHSVHMAGHTLKAVGGGMLRAGFTALRSTPQIVGAGLMFGAFYLLDQGHQFIGGGQIGDMRIRYR